jgi:hypothetical protein
LSLVSTRPQSKVRLMTKASVCLSGSSPSWCSR